jgi:hypothetical protein
MENINERIKVLKTLYKTYQEQGATASHALYKAMKSGVDITADQPKSEVSFQSKLKPKGLLSDKGVTELRETFKLEDGKSFGLFIVLDGETKIGRFWTPMSVKGTNILELFDENLDIPFLKDETNFK